MTEETCKNVATIQRFWPGEKPDLVCVEHAMASEQIGKAMGFAVLMMPIGYSLDKPMPTELPTCCCSKGLPQTVEVG